MRRPRRNSDGTMSFPSQNPYTDRRPDEPKMPKGMEWSMLSKDERERLRGLSKEHAENIGLHILAAFALEESDPELALEHAKWVARQASASTSPARRLRSWPTVRATTSWPCVSSAPPTV